MIIQEAHPRRFSEKTALYLKKRRPKHVEKGGGARYWVHFCSMGPKLQFFENWASQHHFVLSNKSIAPKLENLVLVKVGGFWLFWCQTPKIPKSKIWVIFSQNPPTVTSTRFSNVGAIDLIQSTKWCWDARFSKNFNFGPVQISAGNSFQSRNLEISTQNRGFRRSFCRNFWGVAGRNFYH